MAAIGGIFRSDRNAAFDPHAAELLAQRLVGPPGEATETWRGHGACLVAAGYGASNLRAAGDLLKIVADVRLDDRAAVAHALGLDPTTPDPAIVLAAYERWGVDCTSHLTGDFAFAIWDGRSRALYCARDPFGVKPLYYRGDRDGLAFASRLEALSRPGDTLDRQRLASYLAGIDDDAADTSLAAVRRLPMGCWLLWTPERLRLERWINIKAEPVPPGDDFAVGFRERFLEAVDDRSLGVSNLGAMLSGGLDSSAIVSAVGRRGGATEAPLRTFSFAYPYSPQFDESDYASAVIARYPVVADFVDMDDLAPLDGLADLAPGGDDLFFAPGLPKITKLLARARRSGVRVVLDGHGGDEVVSFGYGRLGELARARRWAKLYRELRGVAAESGKRPGALVLEAMLSQGRLGRLRARLRRSIGAGTATRNDPLALLDRDFARATDAVERLRRWNDMRHQTAADPSAQHLWNVSSPAVSRAFETLRRAGDQVGVELRFPFYDLRLVRYALAIPEHEKFRDGWSRSVLRRATAGILPDKVRWRRTKVDFGAELAGGLTRHHLPLLKEVLRQDAPVGEYVDLAAARGIVQRLVAAPSSGNPELFALWRVVLLALWLSNRDATAAPNRVLS